MAELLNDRYVEVSVSPPPNIMEALMDELSKYVRHEFDLSYHNVYGKMIEEASKWRQRVTSKGAEAPTAPLWNFEHVGGVYHTGKYVNGLWVDGITIDLEIEKSSDGKTDKCNVKLYNVDPTFGNCFIGQQSAIVIKAGYLEDYGTIFSGLVDSVEVVMDGNDRVVNLSCTNSAKLFLKTKVDDRWPGGMKFTDIFKDVVNKYTDIPLAFVQENDYLTPWDFIITAEHEISYWLDELIDGLNTYIRWKGGIDRYKWSMIEGRIYVMLEGMGIPMGLFFDSTSGLLKVEEVRDGDGKNNEGKYSVVVMLNHRVIQKTIVKVQRESQLDPQFFTVTGFKFVSSGDDHQVEMDCKLIKNNGLDNVSYGIPIEAEPIDDVYYEDIGGDFG